MKTLLYANRAQPKNISVIEYYCLLAAASGITKLRCMHWESYLCYAYVITTVMEYKYCISMKVLCLGIC